MVKLKILTLSSFIHMCYCKLLQVTSTNVFNLCPLYGLDDGTLSYTRWWFSPQTSYYKYITDTFLQLTIHFFNPIFCHVCHSRVKNFEYIYTRFFFLILREVVLYILKILIFIRYFQWKVFRTFIISRTL